MEKFKEITFQVLIGIAILILQIYLFNNIKFFGAKINLVLIYIAVTAVFKNMKWSVVTSIIMGVIIDIIFKAPLFKYLAIYLVISIVINLIISKYRKESKLAIVYIIGISTLVFEISEYIFYAINKEIFVNIFSFLMMAFISIIINVLVALILNKLYGALEIRKNTRY